MKEEIIRLLQQHIDQMQSKGVSLTLDDINRNMQEIMQKQNNAPREYFEGYSSIDMHMIIHSTFDKNSPIQLRAMTTQEYAQIPIMRQIKHLTQIVSQNGQIKLTSAGYLPVKIVQDLYPLGLPDKMIESGITKLYREAECLPVNLARIIAEVSGVLKKRKGALTLTEKGKKIITDDKKLFETIFVAGCEKYNWHYFDLYDDDVQSGVIGQMGFGLSLILLCKYGDTMRLSDFYADKYFRAFPMMLESIMPTYDTAQNYCYNCYSLRTFERFFNHFGLIEMNNKISNMQEDVYVKKTPLFDKLISITPHKEL